MGGSTVCCFFCLWISRLCLLFSLSKSTVLKFDILAIFCSPVFANFLKVFFAFILYPFLKSRFR